MLRFVAHRVGDPRLISLIRRWLKAGVLEDGKVYPSEEGTPQGGSISVLLSNLYLHYVLDLWVQRWRKRQAHGDVVIVRWADDFVLGFQHRHEAERFLTELRERLAQFGLALHPDKTRLIEFGRFAEQSLRARDQGKPPTFNFLGFTHSCAKTRKGKFTVLRQTMRKRWQAKLREVKAVLRQRMHLPIPEQGAYLRAVVLGHNRYYGVPMNSPALGAFRWGIGRVWWRVLNRRSQGRHVSWSRVRRLVMRWTPSPRICHGYPRLVRAV